MQIIEYEAGKAQQNNIAPEPVNSKLPKRIEFTPPQPGPPKKNPQIIEFGQSFAQAQQANNTIRNYLENVDDPMSSMSKIRTTMIMSQQLGLSPDYVYNNYDQLTEKISGISNNPQKFGEYIGNQLKTGRIYINQVELWADIKNNPESDRRAAWFQGIELLEKQIPPVDISDKGWLTGMVGSTANLLPYSWAVGKHLVPGAILALLSKGLMGKESIGLGLSILAKFAITAGNANSFGESLDLAGGIIFGDLMEMRDPEGKPVNEDIARTVANWGQIPYAGLEFLGTKLLVAGTGPISDALKKIGAARIKPFLERASARALSGLTVEGAFRGALETLSRGVVKVVGTAVAGTGEEIFEELSQEIIQRTANEIAKEFTNELEGTEFEPEDLEDWQSAMIETVKQTAQATFLLQLPNMVRAGTQAGRIVARKEEQIQIDKELLEEDEVIGFASIATEEEFDEAVEVWSREEDSRELKKPVFTVSEEAVKARAEDGSSLGNIDYTFDEEDNILIDEINLEEGIDIEVADDMMDAIREKFPDKIIVEPTEISPEDLLGRTLQDRDPVIKEYNKIIDDLQTEIETSEAFIEDVDSQIQTIQSAIESTEDNEEKLELLERLDDLKEDLEFAQIDLDTGITSIERIQEEKSTLLKTDPKPEFEMDSQEFRDANPIEKIKGDFIKTKQGKEFSRKLKENFPVMTPQEIEGAVELVSLRANRLDVSPVKYIKDTFVEDIFAKPGDSIDVLGNKHKAGVDFADEGRAMLFVKDTSDFSSWVHELAHIFRRELTEQELNVASGWATKEARKQLISNLAQAELLEDRLGITKVKKEIELLETGEWTNSMEEVFAEGFENYIWEGKTDQEGMKSIFQKFAEYMRKIYISFRESPHITKEMKMLFDGLLSEERLKDLNDGTTVEITRENAEGKLFQTDKKFDSMPEKDLNQSIEDFGLTEDINEAGYVLPDGRMLDFTGRKGSEGYIKEGDRYVATGRDYLAGRRFVFHSEIHTAIEVFLDMGGARVDARNGFADLGALPTPEQYKQIRKIVDRGEVQIELADGTRKDYLISSAGFTKVKAQIDRFYAGNSINRNALFQPDKDEYVKKIKEAVNKGYDVPIKILKQFPDEKWAVDEIERRKDNAEMLSDFDWLTEMAQGFDTYEEFKDEAVFGTQDIGDKWLENFYEIARQQISTIDINEGNKRWIKKLTDRYIIDSIIAMSKNVKKARDAGVPVSLVAQAERYKTKKTINDSQIVLIRKIYKNNPAKMREFVGEFGGDKTELKKLQKEREFAREFEIVDEMKRPEPFAKNRYKILRELEDVRLQGKVRDGSLTLEEIDIILAESEKVIRDDNDQIKKLTKEFARTRSEAVKAAIKKTKDERNKHYKDRDSKRKLKQHIRDLGKYISRPIPTTVAIEQRLIIESLRKTVDPHFRTDITIVKREIDKVIAGDLTAKELGITQKKLESLNKKSLGEISVEELENMKSQIKGLINIGKAIKAARKEAKETKDLSLVEAFNNAMTKGKAIPDQPPFVSEKRNLKDIPEEFYLGNMRLARVADMMDGGIGIKGGDFKGPIHDFFVNDFDDATNAELEEFFKRRDAWEAKYNELGITAKELSKVYEISGLKITAAEIAGVYAFYRNEKARGHVEFGNGITENMRNEMVQAIPEKILRMADYMIEDFSGDNFERLRDARRVDENRETKREDNYMPIHTLSMFSTGVEAELSNRDFKRKTLKKKFLLERKNISEESHKEIGGIELDIFSTWEADVRDHEHYIAHADIISRANRILSNSDFKAATRATGFKLHANELQQYVNRVANPSINKSHTVWNRAVRHLRRSSSIAYLSFNVVTMMKQAPSIALFMGYSSPADLLSGMYQTITAFEKTREIMERLAPQMRERSVERYIDELKKAANKDFLKIVEKVGLAGMKGIIKTDQLVVTAGWKAVYDKNRRSMSKEDAARIATRAVLNTQPASSAKDVARIYAEDNFLSIFLQFTNQLNQIFNIATYDAPQALLHHHFGKMSGLYMGLTISALAMWMIANRRLPRDDEDFREVFTDQVVNSLPVFGRVASSEMDGFNYTLPILTPVTKGIRGLSLAGKALFGEELSEKELERMIFSMYEAVGTGVGIPYIGPKRIYEGIKNKKPLQYIMFGGEIDDTE
ncbi:MAG: hypothetical protein E3J23_08715 [Candidatus Stahlbacteria bacterium]|nr:MAG: hypothetical protein E3J23_08715 [Candidatus Stahlbacteria bacterium]